MLVVAFSVTATTTGIAILGFHATVITLRVLASLVMNHADFLAMDAFAALTAVVAFVAVPAVLAIVLVTAFGTGFGLALLLGRRALLFRILLFAGLPIGLATLIGTLDGAPLAIVGSTLFAGFGTLLLMQPRVLFATLVVALLLVLLALLLLDFRIVPNDARVPRIRGCRGLRTWRRDVRRDSVSVRNAARVRRLRRALHVPCDSRGPCVRT